MKTAKLAVDFPQNVTFFVGVTLTGLVRISKMKYIAGKIYLWSR